MEMQAVICGLRLAGRTANVTVYSDSQYVCNGFNRGWLERWKRNGWRSSTGAVFNQDLWTELSSLVDGDGRRTVKFQWVRGHAGDKMNERADRIAREEAEGAGRHRQPAQGRRARRGR